MKKLALHHLKRATSIKKSVFIIDTLNEDLTISIDLYLNLTHALYLGKE